MTVAAGGAGLRLTRGGDAWSSHATVEGMESKMRNKVILTG